MTDVLYQMTVVGHLFTYVKTWERGRVNHYNAFFPVDPDDRVIMESQCIRCKIKSIFIFYLK